MNNKTLLTCVAQARECGFNPKDQDTDPRFVYIGRGSPRQGLKASVWGNPFRAFKGDHQKCVDQYRSWLNGEKKYRDFLPEKRTTILSCLETLRGKMLVCHCRYLPDHACPGGAGHACHGEVLIEQLEEKRQGQQTLEVGI